MIDFIGKRKVSFAISTALFLASLVALFTLGLKPSIDFTGGSLLEVTFTHERPEVQEIVSVIEPIVESGVVVQPTDEQGAFIKTRFISEDEHQVILAELRNAFEYEVDEVELAAEEIVITEDTTETEGGLVLDNGLEITAVEGSGSVEIEQSGQTMNRVLEERIETIGPAISSQLRSRSWQTGITVILAIVAFVAYAFRKVSKPVASWKYGITAIIALVHDITITMGVFALLGHFYGVEVGIPFVVALLTILGYSVNDTIVVFDRVRENQMRRRAKTFEEAVNMGVNQTLMRSINTSVTTLVVLGALFLFGSASIKFFALSLIVGIILGTYSSIFLASPILVVFAKLKKRS